MTVKRFNLRKEKRRLKEMKQNCRKIYLETALSYGHFVLKEGSNAMRLWSPKRSQEELRLARRNQRTANEEPEGETVYRDDGSIFMTVSTRKTWNGRFA